MQLAAFAQLTKIGIYWAMRALGSKPCSFPIKMAYYGGFPRELHRTKPYGYSVFNLDAMTTICQRTSTPEDNLWDLNCPDGRCMRKAVAFMVPYIRDKRTWPLAPDVMYFKDWPMRQCSLLFGGNAFDCPDYIELWKKLPADSTVEEVIRNFFVRQPVLWI